MGFLLASLCCLTPTLALNLQAPQPEGANTATDRRTQPGVSRGQGDARGKTSKEAGSEDSREHLTAEDVLRALQRQRPANPVIAPASRRDADGKIRDSGIGLAAKLVPEGFPLISRVGTLVRRGEGDDLWWTFVFDDLPTDQAELPPIKVLPNATLEPMARTVVGTGSPTGNDPGAPPLKFEVSGLMTVFQGENYLLARIAMRGVDRANQRRAPRNSDEGDKPDPPNGAEEEAAMSDSKTLPEVAVEGDVEDVLRALQEERSYREPVSMVAVTPASNPDDPPSVRPALIPDGSPIMERAGRLVRQGTWWTLAFESDHRDHPELPMRVLPNQSLEKMVETMQSSPIGLVFIVSGHVTVFEGENYLLAQVARRRLASGNLRN